MKSSINASKENNKENENAKPNPITEKIKSDYFLQKLYDIMPKKKKLEIVKYNKRVQNRLDLGIKDYKEVKSNEENKEKKEGEKKDKKNNGYGQRIPIFVEPYYFMGIYTLPYIESEWPESIERKNVKFDLIEILKKSTN